MKKVLLTALVLLGLVFVSQAQTKYKIGDKFGGGIVFYVDASGEHGLIVETIDQGRVYNLNQAIQYAKDGIHSEAGKRFGDWRLPTKWELGKLSEQKAIVDVYLFQPVYSYFTAETKIKELRGQLKTIRAIRSF